MKRHPLVRPLWLGLMAVVVSSPLGALHAQTYTYIAGDTNLWNDAARWQIDGTPAGDFPDDTGVIASFARAGSNVTFNLGTGSYTIGELRFNETGSSAAGNWTSSTTGTLNFQKSGSGSMPVIYAGGGTIHLRAAITTTQGLDIQGTSAVLLNNAASSITGGITKSSGGSLYLYHSAPVVDQTIDWKVGPIHLGTGANAVNNTFNNDMNLNGSGDRAIYNNTGAGSLNARLLLTGDLTGTASLLLATEGTDRDNVTELTGTNHYEGTTKIRTHVAFHSIDNFGQGAVTFETTARTLSYEAGNTADLTKNYLNQTRAVTLSVNTTVDTGANDVTWQNAVTGTGRLIKAGSGALTLAGANSYAGTTINAGTVVAERASALGGDAVLGASGKLEVGTAVSVTSLSLTSGAAFAFRLGDDPATLTVSGNQTGNGTFTISIDPQGALTGAYTLISIGGSAAASSDAFVLDSAASALGYLDWNQVNGELTFHTAAVVPEPTTGALLLVVLGGAAWRLRGRRATCGSRM